MSVIIRLQNLPWSANALDIRQYFSGLSIPEGGVHIVGGELGDAFIAFSTDEDARQAFQRNHGKIKEVQINLLLSSRTEMQKVIEAARNMQTPFSAPIIQPAIIPAVVPTISSPQLDIKKEDNDMKVKEETRSRSTSRERSERKGRRRSRSRSRSRDRRERSRDRRERRRRERSRSRDRRDRSRRDRRERSKSRERTRSRERDSRDRRSRDRKRDSRSDEKVIDNNSNNSVELQEQKPIRRTHWDRNNGPRMPLNHNGPNSGVGLLGLYPGQLNTPLDDSRRNIGALPNLVNLPTQQPNLLNSPNDVNGSYPRNDPNKRDWPNKSNRFPDLPPLNPSLLNSFSNFQSNSMRPLLSQDFNQRNLGLYSNNMNMRMPFNQDMGGNINRPGFLNRSNLMSDVSSSHNIQNEYRYDMKKEITHDNDSYRKDSRGRYENCVQLRPYYGGYGDIRRFFHGLHISNSGIKLATDNGKRNGTVYVRFVRSDARPIALSKNGQQLRGVVVEVNTLTDEEFDKCGIHDIESDEEKDIMKHDKDDNSSNNSSKPFNCIVVVDIPTFAKEQDILKMFSDYSLLGIHIYKENKRRNAYVQFNKEEDAERAFGEKNKHTLGGKPVIVRRCTENMMKQAGLEETLAEAENVETDDVIKVKDDPVNSDPYSGNAASYDTDVILLTGMPYKTSDRDVIDFFSDIGLIPTRIHMCQGKYGQSNECYCEFSSPDEAIAALDKNGMPLGNGIVNVEPFPRKEMERRFSGIVENMSSNMQSHLPRFQGRLGPRPMLMGLPPRPLLPNMLRHPPMNRYDGPYDGSSMGPPGCVLGMENVPFKASIDEILDFFNNFDVTSHNVLRRYNDNGTCTGDARVTFSSPSECQKAYEQLRFKKIRDRTIYLRIL